MGFIRGGLGFIASILLLGSFLMMNLFLNLDLSLDYDNVKLEIASVVKGLAQGGTGVTEKIKESFVFTDSYCKNNTDFIIDQGGEIFEVPCSIIEDLGEKEINLTEKINEKFVFAEEYCENNTDFVFSQEGYVFEIPCSVVNDGPDNFVDYGINQTLEKIYYKEYNCGFFECLRTEFPFFLISKQAKDSSKNRFYFYLIISLILIAIMFFLIESKSSWFVVVGSLLVISSLPFIKISAFLSFLSNSFLAFIPILFSESYMVFLISFILGVIILGVGILLKFWDFGNFILEKFGKKEEIKQKNIKEQKIKKEDIKQKPKGNTSNINQIKQKV